MSWSGAPHPPSAPPSHTPVAFPFYLFCNHIPACIFIVFVIYCRLRDSQYVNFNPPMFVLNEFSFTNNATPPSTAASKAKRWCTTGALIRRRAGNPYDWDVSSPSCAFRADRNRTYTQKSTSSPLHTVFGVLFAINVQTQVETGDTEFVSANTGGGVNASPCCYRMRW